MDTYSEPYQDLFEEIRKLHNRLRWLGDEVHADAGQTTAKRNLLLTLHREGPTTVPDIARERLVSRQIIQTQMNTLLEDGLVAPRKNPRHKRSSLMALTRKGREMVERMMAREAALLEDFGSPLNAADVSATSENLRRIRLRLEEGSED